MEYDSYLSWNLSIKCNFDCDYCFHDLEKRKSIISNPIDINKVMNTLKKTKKKYLIVFTGGEPFLIPNFIELCKALTQEYYIGIVTNLSCTDAINRFVNEINPERVQNISASYHPLEYQKKRITDNFFVANYNLLKKHNFNVDATYVVYPSLIFKFEKDILHCRVRGINMYSRLFIGNYNNKDYPSSYSQKDMKKILKYHLFGNEESVYFENTLCNAGYNVAAINPDGNVFACYRVPLKLGNIFKKIKFNSQTLICPAKLCSCPLKLQEPQLFNDACKKTQPYSYLQQKKLLTKENISPLNFDRLIGQIGLLIKKYNPNLYYKLKRIKDG